MAVASIVAAAVATWAILRLFLSEDDAAAPLQHSPNNESIENPTEDHVENPGRAINETHRNHIKRLIIAVILTIPTFIMTNPWLHAIIATPVMFYCAAPAHNHGTAALKKRTPNAASLLSLAMTIVYVYSLLACVVSWIFPAGSRNQYFAFASMVAVLSLAISPIEQRSEAKQASQSDIPTAQPQAQAQPQEMQESQGMQSQEAQQSAETLVQASIKREIRMRVMQITTTVTMVIAVWTFALWLVFGLQPKLAIAVLISSTVLAVAGLVLQVYDRQSSI